MVKIGNDKANQLLEHKLPEDDKITPQADLYVSTIIIHKRNEIFFSICFSILENFFTSFDHYYF